MYDLSSDILKLIYVVRGTAHRICISRNKKLAEIKKIYEDICNEHLSNPSTILQYPILHALLNDSTDITKRLNSYLGNRGCHVDFGEQIKIRWILTAAEQEEFHQLFVLTSELKDHLYLHIDDTVLL